MKRTNMVGLILTLCAVASTAGCAAMTSGSSRPAARSAGAGGSSAGADAQKPAEAPRPAEQGRPAAAVAPAAAAPAGAAAPAPAPAKPAPNAQSDELAGKGADLSRIAHSPASGSPYLGTEDAIVVVNIFSDFQCPVCRRSADPIKQLVLDFPGAVKVIFRNNALPSHARSKAAAIAALAAGRQGKFWEYHDRLFANPSALDDGSLRRTAQDLGLDMAQWSKDIADPGIAERVAAESDAAVKLGAPGTPSLFINGTRQVGWGSYMGLRGMVEREITQSEQLASSGTPPDRIPAERIKATAGKNSKMPGEGPIDPELWVRLLLD